MFFDKIKSFGLEFWQSYTKNNLSILATSLAYNTIFAIAPLIYVSLYVLQKLTQDKQISQEVFYKIQEVAGSQIAQKIQNVLDIIQKQSTNQIMGIVSIILVLLLITNLIHNFKLILNIIWQQKLRYFSLTDIVYEWFINILSAGILGITWIFLFLVSGLISYILNFLKYNYMYEFINISIFWLITGLTVAVIMQLLVKSKIHTKPLVIGSMITSLFVLVGRYAILVYLNQSTTSSIYSSAGSVFVFLLWLYYSALILLIGCQITHLLDKNHKALNTLPKPLQ